MVASGRALPALERRVATHRRPRAGGAPSQPAEHARVPPPRFVENLRTLVAQAGDAEVLFLAFPLEDPAPTAP